MLFFHALRHRFQRRWHTSRRPSPKVSFSDQRLAFRCVGQDSFSIKHTGRANFVEISSTKPILTDRKFIWVVLCSPDDKRVAVQTELTLALWEIPGIVRLHLDEKSLLIEKAGRNQWKDIIPALITTLIDWQQGKLVRPTFA